MFGLSKKKRSCMEAEILAEPKIVEEILGAYVTSDNQVNIEVPQIVNRITIVASGSSYNCARYAAEMFSSVAKIEARAIYSGEFLLKETIGHGDDILYIFVTQSGETTDTNNALEKANKFGVNTLCITNYENSSIWHSSKYHIACLAGEEKSIAATKSLTSQLLCSVLLALKLAQNKGLDTYGIIEDLRTLPEFLKRTFELKSKIKQFARFISKYKNVNLTADGEAYALAKEAALKIKETSYINTNSIILSEFMHGHLAVLNNHNSVVLYITNEDISYSAIKNLGKIKDNYNPPICIIGNRTNQVKYTYNLNLDCNSKIVKTFCVLTIIQLLALEIAQKLRKNVDKPHGLNKVVQ